MTMSGSNPNAVIQIKDLKPGLNNLNLTFIVIEIGRPTTTKENQVRFLPCLVIANHIILRCNSY